MSQLTYHYNPCDQRSTSDVFQGHVIDIWLHFKVEQKALIDDIG